MTEEVKNWVFTPGQDFQPGAALFLGQVLGDWRDPASGLIPKTTDRIALGVDTHKDEVHKKGVRMEFMGSMARSFAAYCNAKGLFGGVDAQQTGKEKHRSNLSFSQLSSEMFQPSLEFCKEVLNAGDVPNETQWWKLRRRIFLVTGLRIASGGSKSSLAEKASHTGVHTRADLQQPHAPVQVGVGGEQDAANAASEDTEEISPFIFAYRLHEITYRVWTSYNPIGYGHTASHEDGVSTDEDTDHDDESLPEPEGYELEALKDDPFGSLEDPNLSS